MAKRERHISTRRELNSAVLLDAIVELPDFPTRESAALLNQVDVASVATCLDKVEIDHIHVRLTGREVRGLDHWATVALPERDLFAENVTLDGAWVIDRTATRFEALAVDRSPVQPWHTWLDEVSPALDPAGVIIELADHPSQEQYIAVGEADQT